MATTDRRGVVVSATDPAQGSDPNPGLAMKTAVAVATIGANIALAGLQIIDGIATIPGDRVLVKDQVDQTTNGIYSASTGNWTRTTDADANSDFAPGVQVNVLNGTMNAGKTYKLTTPSPVVLGTSLIVWVLIAYPFSALEWQIGGDVGGGAVLLPGLGPALEIPFNCSIVRARLSADRVGSMVADFWVAAFGVVPSVANSICAAARPTLAGAQFSSDAVLTGWTTALAGGSLIWPNIVSASAVRLVTLSLLVSRN